MNPRLKTFGVVYLTLFPTRSPDVNECKVFPGLCTHGTCRNSVGSFHCSCDKGFALDARERNCTGRCHSPSGEDRSCMQEIVGGVPELNVKTRFILQSPFNIPSYGCGLRQLTTLSGLQISTVYGGQAKTSSERKFLVLFLCSPEALLLPGLSSVSWGSWATPMSTETQLHMSPYLKPSACGSSCLHTQTSSPYVSVPTDIDECHISPDLCGHGSCVNTPGSFACDCFPGFTSASVLMKNCVGEWWQGEAMAEREPCAGGTSRRGVPSMLLLCRCEGKL